VFTKLGISSWHRLERVVPPLGTARRLFVDCIDFGDLETQVLWSGVIRAGAPGRGASASRSSTLNSANGIICTPSQRRRQYRTVLIVVAIRVAIVLLVRFMIASTVARLTDAPDGQADQGPD